MTKQKLLNTSTTPARNPVYIGLCVLIIILAYLILMRIKDIFWPTTEGFQTKNKASSGSKKDDDQVTTTTTTASIATTTTKSPGVPHGFHLAGYEPIIDLILSRALVNKLKTIIETRYTMSPIASDQVAKLKNQDLMSRELAKIPSPEMVPRLYTYITTDQPNQLKIMLTKLKKNKVLQEVLANPNDGSIKSTIPTSRPTDKAVKSFDSIWDYSEQSQAAADPKIVADLEYLLKVYPFEAMDLFLNQELKTAINKYINMASGTMIPLEYLQLDTTTSRTLGLGDSANQTPNSDIAILPNSTSSTTADTSGDQLREERRTMRLADLFDTWLVTFITDQTAKTKIMSDQESSVKDLIMTTLFKNPLHGINMSPDRVQVFKMRMVSDGLVNVYLQVGNLAGEQSFESVRDIIAKASTPIVRNLVELTTETRTDSTRKPDLTDYALTLPIYDFQRIKVVVKTLEKDV